MKIAVGTTSKQKLQFLEEVLRELSQVYSLESFEVSSGISDQPITSKETKQGSLNRAKAAILRSGEADFSLGIEVGYHPNSSGDYEMFCWATLVDKKGNRLSTRSHKLLLPTFHQNILKENKYLGEFVRQYLNENPDELSQQVGVVIRDRKPFIQTAIKSVLLKYFVK